MSKSVLQSNKDICYICSKYIYNGRDCHHIFGGGNRRKSEEDGMKVYVHRQCHREIHNNPQKNKELKARCQMLWQLHYNKTTNDFIKRYGKNYMEEQYENSDTRD